MRYSHHSLVPLLALLLGSGCLGAVADPELLVDPAAAPAAALEAAGDQTLLKQFRRVHILVFTRGEILGPSPSPGLRQASGGNAMRAAAQLAEACHRANVEFYYALDLLRWGQSDAAESQGEPGWFELGPSGTCTTAGDPTRYASPFHPDVKGTLVRLVQDVTGWSPRPAGLTLSLRLSPVEALGYSEAGRAAYIRARSLDPIDLVDARDLAQWARWREEYMTEVVRQVTGAVHARRPDMDVVAWGTGMHYAQSPTLRGRTADSWLEWMARGFVSEALLDADWRQPWNRSAWAILRRVAAEGRATLPQAPVPAAQRESNTRTAVTPESAPPPADSRAPDGRHPRGAGVGGLTPDTPADILTRLHPVVRTRDAQNKPCLREGLEALQSQGVSASDAVFWPVSDGDWSVVADTVRSLGTSSPAAPSSHSAQGDRSKDAIP